MRGGGGGCFRTIIAGIITNLFVPAGWGSYSRDFTICLPPQCRAFGRDLLEEKSLLFLGSGQPWLQMTSALNKTVFIMHVMEFSLKRNIFWKGNNSDNVCPFSPVIFLSKRCQSMQAFHKILVSNG